VMGNVAVKFAAYMTSIVICMFSVFVMLINAWFGNVFDLVFVKLACVATLSLLLAILLYGKSREF